jgi:hypothetical protein
VRLTLLNSASNPFLGDGLAAHACRALCRARVAEELQRRRGTRIGVHLKLVLSVLDRAGLIAIGKVSMTIGFARDWLAWHDQQKTVREAKFRRWQFIASALVFLAAIGLALKVWLKW